MPRVVVVGSSNTDLTVRLPRLPAPGQTVLGHAFASTPGGKGANQALAARRAGAEVVFITAVGDDPMGHDSLAGYRREGIDVDHARVVEGVASGVALIYVADDGENMIGVAPGANQRLMPEDIDALPDSLFREEDVLLVSLEIPIETAIRALQRGFDAGMFTILNPAPAPSLPESGIRELLACVAAVTPNRAEAMALAGIPTELTVEPDWGACGVRLSELGAACAVITLGSRGCQIVAALTPEPPISAHRVAAVDTVGAGDAFNGVAGRRGGRGAAHRRGGAWACAAAALAVTKPGAQAAMPRRAEIDELAARGVPARNSGSTATGA